MRGQPIAVPRAALLLLVGFGVRECFSFWTGHPFDFELWVRMGFAVSHGVDPYGLLPAAPGLSFADVFSLGNTATIAYLPFWPIVTGCMFALYSSTGIANRFLYYFLLKQPVIIGDVALGYLLFSYVSARRPSAAKWVLSFWLFSPFTIILSGIWGMFDSLAICFLMISAVSLGEVRRSLWIGWAIFVKSIPVIYAIPMTLKRSFRGSDVAALIIAVGLPAVLSAGIFFVMRWPFSIVGGTLISTVGKGGSSMSVWDLVYYFDYLGLQIIPTAWYYTLGFVWIPITIIFTLVALWSFKTETDHGLFQALLVCTLAFLISKARITEQYALYFFALSAVDVAVWHPERKRLLLASVAVAMIYLVVNNWFMVRFLSPVYPAFGNVERAIGAVIGSANYTMNLLSATAFTCLNIKYLIEVLRQREKPVLSLFKRA